MSFFCLMMVSSFAQAATITTCTFDKESCYPGQTGYVAVTVYNDEESTVRIFELTATIDCTRANLNSYGVLNLSKVWSGYDFEEG